MFKVTDLVSLKCEHIVEVFSILFVLRMENNIGTNLRQQTTYRIKKCLIARIN